MMMHSKHEPYSRRCINCGHLTELHPPIGISGMQAVSDRFLGIIGQNPNNVCKSNRRPVTCCKLSSVFIKKKLKVYFVDSSIRISRFPEVLNFNQVFLKLNHFFLDLTYWPVPPCSSGAKIRKIDLSSVLKPGFHRDSQYFNRIFSIFNLNKGNILWNIVSPEEYYYGS